MPVYEAKCNECNTVFDYNRKVADRNDVPQCECGGAASRCVSAARSDSRSDLYPFTRRFGTETVTITNRAEKLAAFRKHDLYEMPTNYGDDSPNIGEI